VLKNKILSNTALYTIALLLPQLVGFILLPVYTRYFDPGKYAIVALVNTATNIASIFIALQLQSAIARYVIQYVSNNQKQKAKEFFTTIMITMIVIIIVCFTFLEIFGNELVDLIFPNSNLEYSPYFRLSLMSVILMAIYQAPLAIFKVLQMAKHFLLLNVVVTISSVSLTLIFLILLDLGLLSIFLGTFIGALIGCITSIIFIKDWFTLSINIKAIPKALKYSLPLIPHSLGTFLFTGANRIILERYVSLEELGIFSLGSKISMVTLLLVGTFNMAYNPHFIQIAEKNEKLAVDSNKIVIGYWYVGVLSMVLGVLIFSDIISGIMTTRAYSGASTVMIIISFSSIFRGLYTFAVSPFFFKKKTIYIPIITFIAGLVGLLLNYLLIPVLGIEGAAYATVFSYLLTFIIAIVLSRKVMIIKYPWKKMLLISIMFVFLWSLNQININLILMSGLVLFLIKVLAFTGFVFLGLLINNRTFWNG